MIKQRMRWFRIAADCGLSSAEDTGFLVADRFARRAQPVGMIERDARHHGTVGVVSVDGVEPTAEADLKDDYVNLARRKDLPGRQRAELEVGQRDIAGTPPGRFDL